MTEVLRVGHLEREPADGYAVSVRGHIRRQDVDLLVGERTGHVGQQLLPIERLDRNRDEELRPAGRLPTDVDEALFLQQQVLRVDAVLPVHADAARTSDEA